ncbi:hypothetical protein [Peribacillus alkalitolerans]|uniref:hypothetical protein n=1 Tax=Peribacillus alkalitolerans TaxID=1550385 RepID=UPI0013D07B4F|nr:hypothetical protein [Peribacillus alkalitolerans]
MSDFKSIVVTKRLKILEINNPTDYPLIGKGSQGAVFKLSEEKCVKIYADPVQARMEVEALKAGKKLNFMPKIYESGKNYIVMDYFDGPNLRDYLLDCMYMPEEITIKLLNVLMELKKAKYTMLDAPLRHIIIVNNELKLVDHVNAFKRMHSVPIKLLRDLHLLLLKDSFLTQVKKLEPQTYKEWERVFNQKKIDYKSFMVTSGAKGHGVKADSTVSHLLIGKGHQGAVYRLDENRCVKIYGREDYARQEKEVLLSSQKLSFIPKVYKTGPNYIEMEYLSGPDLNTYLKKQSKLPEEISKQLYNILTQMENNRFKQIDAPLRHIIITNDGFKLLDHVFSFTLEKRKPIELFENLQQLNFLDSFLEFVKETDSKAYQRWLPDSTTLIG